MRAGIARVQRHPTVQAECLFRRRGKSLVINSRRLTRRSTQAASSCIDTPPRRISRSSSTRPHPISRRPRCGLRLTACTRSSSRLPSAPSGSSSPHTCTHPPSTTPSAQTQPHAC
ncbi:hypothetical protein PsYK624_100700 [Phanerochaete sordida]|uniref:Uncharacterized protein n=1 Tax=Phanerochaete sordida TaxID=48140 RepID=A0A9P3GFH3_9APHY|nr:hypothetical protein PsYK624_100700 [Phanerochaete sordida]